MVVRRREILQTAAAAALGHALAGCRDGGIARGLGVTSSVEAALRTDPKGVLDLPPGFSYRVLQRTGDRMSDGYRVPGRPDAMGCFPGPGGSIVLMRNHEMSAGDVGRSPYFPGQAPPKAAYDPEGTGGVTRMVLDPETLALKRSNLVLCGTYWNCAGGSSPWGWLSCEETVDDPRHGYVFLCAVDAEHVQAARRIPGYGRMRHEAASVDPRTNIAYLTEDRADGCFYRFVPKFRERPFEGVLQALAVDGKPGFSTADQAVGERLAVRWVDVENPDCTDDSVRSRAVAAGAAVFCRGEGLWLADGAAHFSATAGGPGQRGQIFRLGFGPKATLEVIADGGDSELLDMPDNLCISPHGQLYVAEDGSGQNYLRRIGLDGRMRPFARNARSDSEFAGPCFSPDGRTLFLNVQAEGVTFAVRGPFEEPLPGEGPASDRHPFAGEGCPSGARSVRSGLAMLALAAVQRRRNQLGARRGG